MCYPLMIIEYICARNITIAIKALTIMLIVSIIVYFRTITILVSLAPDEYEFFKKTIKVLRRNINVLHYLTDVLERLPYCKTTEDYQALTPNRWKPNNY